MKKVLKQVLSIATGEKPAIMEQLSLEQLRLNTIEALKDTRYFLVLDDLWNEDSNEWLKLKEMLDVGAKGSAMIVTTRSLKVASIVQTVEEYKLPVLSNEICLQIFKQLAFADAETIEPTLLNLVNEIVEKSQGLPLLVTTLGNLLRGEKDEKEWRRIIRKIEQGHEDILKILKLSYDQLPSCFKICFRISSIYSKGDEILPLFDVIPVWRALGLLPCDEQGEALARKCIRELVSKSLFRRDDSYETSFSDDMMVVYQMHDFVHDLAKYVTGEELAIISVSTKEVFEKARYVRLKGDDFIGNLYHERLLSHAKKARVLKIETTDHSINKAFLQTIFSMLTFLRVLDLSNCQFEDMPRTIGYMMHLRYLNLANNARIEQIPDSMCNLINLQTLILAGCTNLKNLPVKIGRLENLKFLALTMQQECLPEDIGHIKGLRVFILHECPWLAYLPMSTKQLENLEMLMILDCEELDLTHGSWSIEGLKSMRMLFISNVPKFQKLSTGLPFPSLQDLVVIECEGLVDLTDWINHLASLKTLSISNCPNLVGMPHTLYLLDKLEKLVIVECPALIERCTPEKGIDWHLISHIPHIQLDDVQIIKDVIQTS